MLWAALLPDPLPLAPPQRTEALLGLATWCLQFTPRVVVLEPSAACPAVAMELDSSVRLFGGKRHLVEQVKAGCAELGVGQLSWGPTSLAAVALARAGVSNGFAAPIEAVLDALPMNTLSAAIAHEATLARLGCRTLGDIRALPRGGLSRRFDAALLAGLDQAYGLRPEVHAWIAVPDVFVARIELMARVEQAPALLFAARRLLLQMMGWLAARRTGVTAYTLRWRHDALRAKAAGEGGEHTVRTAQPTRDVEHLLRLLAEHLAKVRLLAPVGELELLAIEVRALEDSSGSLLPEAVPDAEDLALVLERIAARFGPERVLRPLLREDHRPEWMGHWQAALLPLPRRRSRNVDVPQPTFLLSEPLRLATQGNRPLYQGVLQLLFGPHRIEGGWWDRAQAQDEDGARVEVTRFVARDYFVALSEHAGVLWIFRTRLGENQLSWFLHGVFA